MHGTRVRISEGENFPESAAFAADLESGSLLTIYRENVSDINRLARIKFNAHADLTKTELHTQYLNSNPAQNDKKRLVSLITADYLWSKTAL